MTFFNMLTLGIRFLLELFTPIMIFYGGITSSKLSHKIIFIIISIAIVIIWAVLGAPNSSYALIGLNKLLLEIIIYGIGIASFFLLFSLKFTIVYTIIVIFNLSMMYFLKLQGH